MCSYGITTDAATDNVRDPTYVDGITMQFAQKLGVNPGRRCGNNRSSGSDCCCNFIALGNYCGRTEEKRLEEAHRRMSNRVFNLGITAHGYQEPILEAINPNPKYRDPNIGKPQISSYLPSPVENVTIDYEKVAENFRSIDVYSGLVDGKHYGLFNRLRQHKIRHTRNPNGTETRFCIPITNSMNCGWWNRDLEQLNITKWYEARERAPIVRGDITKFVDEMYHHDPSFMLF